MTPDGKLGLWFFIYLVGLCHLLFIEKGRCYLLIR